MATFNAGGLQKAYDFLKTNGYIVAGDDMQILPESLPKDYPPVPVHGRFAHLGNVTMHGEVRVPEYDMGNPVLNACRDRLMERLQTVKM
jgi:hypothetical protein